MDTEKTKGSATQNRPTNTMWYLFKRQRLEQGIPSLAKPHAGQLSSEELLF